jgi:hypothetical protein
MKIKVAVVLIGLILILTGVVLVGARYYPYIFARTVEGEVIGVDRVNQQTMIMSDNAKSVPNSQLFSFAVAIRDKKGEIVTASSEDRQWAVVQKGQCAVAKYFPYPPWDLQKANTYANARLEKLYDCPK